MIQRKARPADPEALDAVCTYRVLEAFDAATVVEVRLDTGKQNQIRIQAQLHGHPLVGERRYVDEEVRRRGVPFARQALHAFRLSFRHPADDRLLRFEAPLPADLRKLLAQSTRSRRGTSRSALSRSTPRNSSGVKPARCSPCTCGAPSKNGASVPNTICDVGTSAFSACMLTGLADPAVS